MLFPDLAVFALPRFPSLSAAVAHPRRVLLLIPVRVKPVSRFAVAAVDNPGGAIDTRFENPDAPFSEAATAF
jgi:hypothetical protein